MRRCFEARDRGQRYEVRAKVGTDDTEMVIGWTNDAQGKPLTTMVELHPVWHSPRVIDRQEG